MGFLNGTPRSERMRTGEYVKISHLRMNHRLSIACGWFWTVRHWIEPMLAFTTYCPISFVAFGNPVGYSVSGEKALYLREMVQQVPLCPELPREV